jgi:hypothetical protein
LSFIYEKTTSQMRWVVWKFVARQPHRRQIDPKPGAFGSTADQSGRDTSRSSPKKPDVPLTFAGDETNAFPEIRGNLPQPPGFIALDIEVQQSLSDQQ